MLIIFIPGLEWLCFIVSSQALPCFFFALVVSFSLSGSQQHSTSLELAAGIRHWYASKRSYAAMSSCTSWMSWRSVLQECNWTRPPATARVVGWVVHSWGITNDRKETISDKILSRNIQRLWWMGREKKTAQVLLNVPQAATLRFHCK